MNTKNSVKTQMCILFSFGAKNYNSSDQVKFIGRSASNHTAFYLDI